VQWARGQNQSRRARHVRQFNAFVAESLQPAAGYRYLSSQTQRDLRAEKKAVTFALVIGKERRRTGSSSQEAGRNRRRGSRNATLQISLPATHIVASAMWRRSNCLGRGSVTIPRSSAILISLGHLSETVGGTAE
jgi:hypothetical protein